MYEVNGIVYASEPTGDMEVVAAKPLGDMEMLVTFSTGETRLFDATGLLDYPAFAKLADSKVFEAPEIDDGVVTWANGEVDISPMKIYKESFEYAEIA